MDAVKLANEVFVRARANGVDFPGLNQCIKCRACEKRCTQKIDIVRRMTELSDIAFRHGYTSELMDKKLGELEKQCRDKEKIGIWPAADTASRIFDFWRNETFEKKCVYFNSSDAIIGSEFRGSTVLGPDDLEKSGVEAIIIMHYRLQETIFQELTDKIRNLKQDIEVIKLYSENDIDWFNRMV